MQRRVSVFSETGYSADSLGCPEKLVEFVAWAQDRLNQIPEPFRGSAKIEIEPEREYDSCALRVEIYYEREETQDELEQRRTAMEENKARVIMEKRLQLERLKKELGEP